MLWIEVGLAVELGLPARQDVCAVLLGGVGGFYEMKT